jgi:hypothetical protein
MNPVPTSTSFSFPIGYYDLHPDISINFQLNRFYGWVGDDSMLTEMREGLAGVNDYPTFWQRHTRFWPPGHHYREQSDRRCRCTRSSRSEPRSTPPTRGCRN